MSKDFLTYLLPILATAISVVVGLINIFVIRKKAKEKREATETYLKTNKTFYALHETLLKTKSLDNHEIFNDINNINSEIKYLFDDLTKSNCRSTIRVIVYDNNVPMVVSLMSQSIKEKSNHQIEFKKTKLFEDTSMSFLFHMHKDYYLNNDIGTINSYLPLMPKSDKDIQWKFVYLSTLMVPISKTEKEKNKDFIYGFLCLDSDKRNAFNKELHVTIAKQISFSLLPLLDKWTKRMIENNNGLSTVIDTPK
jgi:hypothetical protein